jgi:hypothetical protein
MSQAWLGGVVGDIEVNRARDGVVTREEDGWSLRWISTPAAAWRGLAAKQLGGNRAPAPGTTL